MADVRGFDGLLAISTDGVTYNTIGGVKELSMTIDQSTFDVTDHDSGVWSEHIIGRKTVTMSATCNYDEANTHQETLMNTAVMSGTMVYFRYRPRGAGSGLKEMLGSGSVTSVEVSSPNDGPAELSVELQITSTLTRQNQ